jgi:hypothetical protein
MSRLALAVLALTLAVACGSSTPATSASPSAARATAQSLTARPADFTPVALQTCPAPETGDFAAFVAGYRTGIPFHDPLVAVASSVKQASADAWAASMAAPDADPAVCKGALGFGYNPRASGPEPAVVSFVFVLPDAAAGKTVYAQIQPKLVAHGTPGASTGFGSDSALQNDGTSQRLVWLRGSRIAFLLIDDVSSWKEAAKALDTRLSS